MIALTQEKREELAKFAKAALNSLKGIEPENPNQYDDCLSEYTQKCMKIALASLTAEPVGYTWDRGIHCELLAVEINDDVPIGAVLFTSPPVPEIKLPNELMDLVKAVDFYHAVKAENPDTETGAWKDAYEWLKEAAIEAAPVIKRLNGMGE